MLICVNWADWLILLKNSPRHPDERVARFQPLPRPSCMRRSTTVIDTTVELGFHLIRLEYTKDRLFFTQKKCSIHVDFTVGLGVRAHLVGAKRLRLYNI